MIDMHSKYDNMHKNGMFYALICINNCIIACENCILSITHSIFHATRTPDFFILDKVSKPPAPVLGGDNPPKVTPHLVNPPIEITNWPG